MSSAHGKDAIKQWCRNVPVMVVVCTRILTYEKLTLLRRATSAGRRISDIADLSVDALYSLIETDEVAAAQARVIPSERPNTGSVSGTILRYV